MLVLRAQGAIESRSASDLVTHRQVLHLRCSVSRTVRPLLAQGATEYLVLLAVVLIIALVGVALLGFFPGTANDAQITESQIYWRSASPIAITEWGANTNDPNYGLPYLRFRNVGNYPVRITKFVGPTGTMTQVFISPAWTNMSDVFYLAPGEENYVDWAGWGLPTHLIYFYKGSGSGTSFLSGSTSLCNNASGSTDPGTLVMPIFGFEYIQYIEGQQIVKRQIGAKPLVIRCKFYP